MSGTSESNMVTSDQCPRCGGFITTSGCHCNLYKLNPPNTYTNVQYGYCFNCSLLKLEIEKLELELKAEKKKKRKMKKRFRQFFNMLKFDEGEDWEEVLDRL